MLKMLKITFGFRNGMSIDFLCEKFEARTNAVAGLVGYSATGVVGKKHIWVDVGQIMYITKEEVVVDDCSDIEDGNVYG